MFNLDHAIADWRRQLCAAGIDSSEALDELESHLRDDVEARIQLGLSAEAAFAAAVRSLGPAGSLRREFAKNFAKREWTVRAVKLCVAGLVGSAVLTGICALFKLPLDPEIPLSGFGFATVLIAFVWLLRTYRIPALGVAFSLDPHLLTTGAKLSLDAARVEAGHLHHDFIGTEHALLGLFEVKDGIVASVLRNCGLERDRVRTEIKKLIGVGLDRGTARELPCTPRLKRALELALREARAMKHDGVGSEHILLGLLLEGQGVAAVVLRSLGVSIESARAAVLREVEGAGGEPAASGS